MEETLPPELPATPTDYAGFWIRFGAIVLDWIILGIINITISSLYLWFFQTENRFEWEDGAYVTTPNIINAFISWLYFAGLESSKYQATLGKQMVKIYVTDEAGGRISFLRATGRYFSKFISAMILFIGFIMAAFTAKKQALHDIIAGTLVLKKGTVIS